MRIEKRILCIWLPNWPIQRLVVDQPALKGHPILLHTRDSRRGDIITACSRCAKINGVRLHMPMAEATALITPRSAKRPQVEKANVQVHDREADLNRLQELADWCSHHFSPIVGLDPSDTPQGLLLDVWGTTHLFDGEAAMASKVSQAFQEQGYWPHVAIAQTVGAAIAFARFAVPLRHLSQSDFSQSANESEAVPAPLIVDHQHTAEQLYDLPIAALRIEPEPHRLLHQLGIKTIGQLLRLPREGISSRFGEGVLHRIDQILGYVDEVIIANRMQPTFKASITLEHPTDRRNVVERILQQLANQLVQQLAQHDQGAVQVRCEFANVHQKQATFEVGLFRPTASVPHLLSLLNLQLESHILPRSIVTVRMVAVTTAKLPYSQHTLLPDMTRDSPQQLGVLVDRLTSRLGKTAITGTRLRANALPELAYACIPLTGDRSAMARLNASSGRRPAPRPMERPLILLEPPRLLTGTQPSQDSASSCSTDLPQPEPPPSEFKYGNRTQKVQRYWGPERIETAWWKGPCIRRDYYRVESQQGNVFWLFHHLDNGEWFLHGEFA